MSQTKVTSPHDQERSSFRIYAVSHSSFAPLMTDLYNAWGEWNGQFFQGALKPMHLTLGRTPPRALAYCKLTTDWGSQLQITINEGLASGRSPMIRRPWPSEGCRRFLRDLVLHEQVHQFMYEIVGHREEGYRGHGPRFTSECNRIGQELGLPPAVCRNRSGRTIEPVSNHWPLNVRPQDYYLGDVRLNARVRQSRPSQFRHTRNLGVYEFLLWLLIRGEHTLLRRILEKQVDWLRIERSPALTAIERGPRSDLGEPLPIPPIDFNWLRWNDRCVGKIAAYIRHQRAFADMPILADALEEAGCSEPLVLGHCRLAAEHTHECWVLKALLKGDQ